MIEIEAHIGRENGISARGRMRGPSVQFDATDSVTIEQAISLLNRRPNVWHVETPWGGVFAVGSDEDGATYQITINDAKEESRE
jgi:hypothetical protein